MYYFTSSRIDIYLNGVYVRPTNAYNDKNGNMVLRDPTKNLTSFMPTYSSPPGTNLFFNKQMYWSMTGVNLIDVEIAPVLFVSFGVPAMTNDAFFDPDTVVANFAALLGLDPSQIRNVNIVSETASNGRMLAGGRQTTIENKTYIELTIFSDPVQNQNDTSAKSVKSTQLKSLSDNIINQFTTGQLQAQAQALLNITLFNMGIVPPLSSPNSSTIDVKVVSSLSVFQEAKECGAQVPCRSQPILILLDADVGFYLV